MVDIGEEHTFLSSRFCTWKESVVWGRITVSEITKMKQKPMIDILDVSEIFQQERISRANQAARKEQWLEAWEESLALPLHQWVGWPHCRSYTFLKIKRSIELKGSILQSLPLVWWGVFSLTLFSILGYFREYRHDIASYCLTADHYGNGVVELLSCWAVELLSCWVVELSRKKKRWLFYWLQIWQIPTIEVTILALY